MRLDELQGLGFVGDMSADDRNGLLNNATQNALERFDEAMRELALRRYVEFEHDLQFQLTRFVISETIDRLEAAGQIRWPKGVEKSATVEQLAGELTPQYGYWLAELPALEDVKSLVRATAGELHSRGAIEDVAASLKLHQSLFGGMASAFKEAFGGKRPTLFDATLEATERQRDALWKQQVRKINWELFDQAAEAFPWYALQELAQESQSISSEPSERAEELSEFAAASLAGQLGKPVNAAALDPLLELQPGLEEYFRQEVFLWPRKTGPKGDLVDDEMGRVLQVPGWSNIFTQPIINRIEMLSTGVRTDIGVKVFGPDLDTVVRVSKEVETVLKPISGARDVLAAPIMGKGYIEVDIDREKAARYGISVEDIQTEIEMAMAGRAVTYTVEKTRSLSGAGPLRPRRAARTKQSLGRLLVTAGETLRRGPDGVHPGAC